MDIKTYYSGLSAKEKRDFAIRMGTSTGYLSQLANGFRQPGVKTLAIIEQASYGAVTRAELFAARQNKEDKAA